MGVSKELVTDTVELHSSYVITKICLRKKGKPCPGS